MSARTTGDGAGVLEFVGLEIAHDDRVLTPRPWTELQSRWAAEMLGDADAPQGRLLELCSGAGHIGLGAAHLSGRGLVCVDVSEAAVELTGRNARANDLADRVEVRAARLQEALRPGETFALAVADPPWVPSSGTSQFPEDPLLAIDGGSDGLDLARDCVAACRGHLPPGASLLVQLGTPEQADEVVRWAAGGGWQPAGLRAADRGVVLRLLHP